MPCDRRVEPAAVALSELVAPHPPDARSLASSRSDVGGTLQRCSSSSVVQVVQRPREGRLRLFYLQASILVSGLFIERDRRGTRDWGLARLRKAD